MSRLAEIAQLDKLINTNRGAVGYFQHNSSVKYLIRQSNNPEALVYLYKDSATQRLMEIESNPDLPNIPLQILGGRFPTQYCKSEEELESRLATATPGDFFFCQTKTQPSSSSSTALASTVTFVKVIDNDRFQKEYYDNPTALDNIPSLIDEMDEKKTKYLLSL